MIWRRGLVSESMQAVMVGIMCGLVAVPQAAFAASAVSTSSKDVSAAKKTSAAASMAPLTKQEQVQQVLNRFTFGPRMGDAAAVNQMGLEAWFEQQLHPETIDDSAFQERMDQFPAMKLSLQTLMRRYPSNGMIKTMERQDMPLPLGRVERAIYADSEAAYNEKRNGKNGKNAAKSTKDAKDTKETKDAKQAPDGQMMATPDMATASLNKKGKIRKRDRVAPMDDAEVQTVLDLSPDQRLARMISMKPDQMLAFRAALRYNERPQLVQGMTPEQRETAEALLASPERVVGAEVLESRLERDVYSKRQLQAVMTDFWLNHFSVYVKKNQYEEYYLPSYERNVILPNALGNFEKLLVATAASPAMLMYLDNWESAGPHSAEAAQAKAYQELRDKNSKRRPLGINENYGRELMELHTLGVNGGYTQQDVIEVAKCFTGWTINRPYEGGGAVYDDSRHEPGTKIVLGHKITQNGEKEGLEVLHILATSPATAHFISTQLAERFVSDNPPKTLVDRMAGTFLRTHGDIKSVLTTMFHSPEFWTPKVYHAKVKTPIEFMASALRASNAQVNNPLPLVQAMDRLGMPVYGMQTPNGYSWKSDAWVSSNALISRMNFALVLASNRVPGTRTNWPALLGEQDSAVLEGAPDATTEKKLETLLLGRPASERTRQTVLAEFSNPTAQETAERSYNARVAQDEDAGSSGMDGARLLRTKAAARQRRSNRPETPLDTMAGLLLGSPEFQRR